MALGVALGVAFGVALDVAFGAALGVVWVVAWGVAGGVARGAMVGMSGDTGIGVAFGVAMQAGVLHGAFYLFQLWFALQQQLRPGIASRRLARHPALRDEMAVLPFPGLGGVLARALAEESAKTSGVYGGTPSAEKTRQAKADPSAVSPARTPDVSWAARHLLRNPYQRWAVARGFARFLAATPDPLAVLFHALPNPLLNEYAVEPVTEIQLHLWPAVKPLWLGALAGDFVDGTGGHIRTSEWLAWAITRPLRGKPHPQIAPLARLLLRLLDEETVAQEGIDGEWLEAAATAIAPLPHGEEVARSLTILVALAAARAHGAEAPPTRQGHAEAGEMDQGAGGVGKRAEAPTTNLTLEDIANAGESLTWLDTLPGPPLRPQVIEALRGLGDVAAEVSHYRQSTAPAAQAAALNRAVGMLNDLAAYVAKINLPERTLLRLAVARWQTLVAEAAGRLGERALREMVPGEQGAPARERRAAFWLRPTLPFPNPYKTGDPVSPPLLAGRGDIFNRIRSVWAGKASPDSVILYGHRRMGKSSILRNLEPYAPPGSLLVYADLKGEAAFAAGTPQLLRNLAHAVAWAAGERGLDVAEPDPGSYTTPAEAALSFRQLLRGTLGKLAERGHSSTAPLAPPASAGSAAPAADARGSAQTARAAVILALDEFEAVDVAVREGRIGREIYDYLRALSQEPRITLVFAGLHTLDEMSRDYRHAFFDSYVNLRVSYLDTPAAERLITRPTPDFALSYHPEVVARVVQETHGQPLLVQRVCQELVNHLNHELFDLELEREARLLPADLDAVLNDDFVQGETRYFDGLWSDQVAGRAAEESLLHALADSPGTAEELAGRAGLTHEETAAALDYLETRDLIAMEGDRWDVLVPLMRRWLRLFPRRRL